VTVTAPPRRPRVVAPADVEALEALFEEARRRARRRRRRNGCAALVAGLIAAGVFYGFGNGGDAGDRRAGSAAETPGAGWSPKRAAKALRNGRLTILGENGIETVSPTGRVRTLIQCDSLSQQEQSCAAHPWSVDWAPDGRRLAYATAVGPGAMPGRWRFVALHVHDTISGAHVRRRLSCFASDIDWSPDGSRLAYVCRGRLYLLRADLAGPPRLLRTNVPGRHAWPTWAPSGTALAFAAVTRTGPAHDRQRIYVLPVGFVDAARPRLLARDGNAPSWSPDGSAIAYRARCGGVKLITPGGIDVTPAPTILKCRAIGVRGAPVWSPDGRQLSVTTTPDGPCAPRDATPSPTSHCIRMGTYIMNADGSALQLVTIHGGLNAAGRGRPSWRP
jgi:hypothetical protein